MDAYLLTRRIEEIPHEGSEPSLLVYSCTPTARSERAPVSLATHELGTRELATATTSTNSTTHEGKRALHTRARNRSSNCMPAFIVAGQSNALGMGGDLPRAIINESVWPSARVKPH